MYIKRYIAAFASILLLLFSIGAQAQIQFPYFIQEEAIKVPGIKEDNQIYDLSLSQRQISRTFLDGLGRPIQKIGVMASPTQKDIVQVITYNNLGQQVKSYLPYASHEGTAAYRFRNNALAEQGAFYSNGTSDKVADDTSPYSQQVFENSPLQRVLQAGGVGVGFQPGQHYKTVNYRSNTSGDNVIVWTAGVNSGTYTAGKLQVSEMTDEDGKQLLTFTNDAGQTILKRQYANEVINSITETYFDTYYLYNENGSVSYILPPKAVALMKNTSNWSLSPPAVDKLIFKFIYDDQGKLIEKTVPGAGVMYVVYDPLDRPVLMQDANLRSTNKWNYIKYDVKGRPVSQGIYTDATYTTRSAMQAYVSGLSSAYNTNYFESRSNASSTGYYSNNCFPTASIDPLAYSYFDDYDLDQNGTADYSYTSQGITGEATPTTITRGLATMVRKKTVGSGVTATWLINIVFYDKYGRVIQNKGNNHLTSTVSDVSTNIVDFAGQVNQTKVVKVAGSTTTTILSTYTYDHAGRLKALNQSYNGATAIRVASYEYNELGQLVKKRLHGDATAASLPISLSLGAANSVTSGTSTVQASGSITLEDGFSVTMGATFQATISPGNYLQNVDFRYNIRGQMTSINNSTLTNDGGIKNEDTNDVFGLELLFDQVDGTLSNSAYYNGRLSALRWMSKDGNGTNGNERSYKYNYDNLNRLKDALYADRTSGGVWARLNAFDEKNITYDHNGNILTLQRNALISGAVTQVDNLSYTYEGNRLTNVADGAGSNYTGLGFKNLTGFTSTYVYDDNGNLVTDPKKGISLQYNVLNRTDKITITTNGNYITYTYDAGGVLLRKQQFNSSNVLQKTTDYSGGFVYENSTLAYFGMPEGRVRNNSGTLKSEYMITDHQGNVRVSFEDNGSGVAVVKQENSYYPFGLVMNGSAVPTPTAANKNLYNAGAEWQNDFGDLPDYYNTFYRNYDAAIGRFVGVDPKAEAADNWTTYQYGYNSPGMFNDPLGDYVAGRMPRQDYSNGIYTRSDNYQPMSQMDAYAWYFSQSVFQADYARMQMTFSHGNAYHAGDGTSADPHTGDMSTESIGGFLQGVAKYGTGSIAKGSYTYKEWSLHPLINYGSDGKVIDGGVLGKSKLVTVDLSANQGGQQPAPAWDVDHNGQLWLIEADRWYRMGNGQAITVAASSVNLKSVDPSIAKGWKVNGVYHVPLLTKNFFNDGVVFGTLDFRFLGNNQVQILPNMYDFDIGADKGHPWKGEFFRNISTWLGEQVATGFGMAPGNGTPYLINFSGVATLGQGPK